MSQREHLIKKSMWSSSKDTITHQLREVKDNCIDELIEGFANTIVMNELDPGHFIFMDNGRGIPRHNLKIDSINEKREKIDVDMDSIVANFTHISVSGKHDESNYSMSKGVNGVGLKLLNAFSEWLVCEVKDKKNSKLTHRYKFINWDDDIIIDKVKHDKNINFSTKIEFKLSPEYFGSLDYNKDYFYNVFCLIKLYYPKSKILFNNKLIPELNRKTYFNTVLKLNKKKDYELNIASFISDKLSIEIMFHFDERFSIPKHKSDVNLDFCGGPFTNSFEGIYSDCINEVIKDASILNDREKLHGLCYYISIKMKDKPIYIGQVKDEVKNNFRFYINRDLREKIKRKIKNSKVLIDYFNDQIRIKQDRNIIKDIKKNKKLYDGDDKTHEQSLNNPGEILYIVEGESASVNAGISLKTSGVLALGGKILNVMNLPIEEAMKSKKIGLLLNSLNFDIECYINKTEQSYRYEKVYIVTDADPDGNHIAFLLSILFFKFMPDKIKKKEIFILLPPPYIGEDKNNKEVLIYKKQDMNAEYKNIRYIKGLGQMEPHELEMMLTDPILYPLALDIPFSLLKEIYTNIEEKRKFTYSGRFSIDKLINKLTGEI